jgi:hypothetical protein
VWAVQHGQTAINPVVDTIRFEHGERADPADDLVNAVDIFVNGRNFVDILREVELPFAARDRQPDLAGSYAGLPPEDIFLPSLRLLGEPTTYYDHDSSEGKFAVLGCECGDPGCWPLRVKIDLRDDAVIWDGFEQPHRSAWRYDALRPFVFDRAQYISALSRNSG